jgi:hypothetical protein
VLTVGGVLLFGAIGLSWYVYSCLKHPGLLSYFIGEEVLGRIAGQHQRNPQWYGAIVIYGPALIAGALPWCLAWPGIVRRWRESLGGGRMIDAVVHRPRALLLALSIVVPLTVLIVARSRLPLYVLPLFVPLALLTARGLRSAAMAGRAAGDRFGLVSPAWARALPVWVAFLIAARLVFAVWPGHANARNLYCSLPRERNTELVLTDTRPHYGLAFYYGRTGERVEYASLRGNRFSGGDHRGEPIAMEVREESIPTDHSHLYLVADADWPDLESMLRRAGAEIRGRYRLTGVVAVITARRLATGAHAP